ncbi:DNA cytosine methyltransferase [Pseudoxanthomonas sp. LjRoot168]|uniref:DNA cytosine methyltransferase n=1 Tax=unclassified Pseudoxanthomonas TaxID=2645906 RepID=UPI003ED08B61
MGIRHIRTLVDPNEPAPRRSLANAFKPHAQVSYTRLGQNRGNPRLWLEGLRLNRIGFEPGTRFRVDLDLDRRQVRLVLDANGDRAVSQRQRQGEDGEVVRKTPIIDVTGGALAEILGEGAKIRATLSAGEIVFDLHPVELAIEEREKRTREQVAQGYLTEATLCAGAGVSTLAFHEGVQAQGLRSRVDWIVDRDHRYLEMASVNNPAITEDTRLYEAALEELEPVALSKVASLGLSLPCTGHSKAGRAKRKIDKAEDHPTDALAVYGALRIVDAVQPAVIVSENVAEARTSASYAIFMAYLQEQGYVLHEALFDSTQSGSLENRTRWWLVAISRGLAEGFSMDQVPAYPKQYETLGQALENIGDDDERWRTFDYLVAKAARDKSEGKNFKPNVQNESATSVNGLTRGYARVRQTDVKLGREDGMQRLLTPVEHARAKGIPEYLVNGFPVSVAHEALGQSILFNHAKGIGEAVGAHLRDLQRPGELPLRQAMAPRDSIAHDVARQMGDAATVAKIRSQLDAPATMTKDTFLAVQAVCEDMAMQVAMGTDAAAGFDARNEEIYRLLEASPWTLHPDYGCVLASDIDELDAEAAGGLKP